MTETITRLDLRIIYTDDLKNEVVLGLPLHMHDMKTLRVINFLLRSVKYSASTWALEELQRIKAAGIGYTVVKLLNVFNDFNSGIDKLKLDGDLLTDLDYEELIALTWAGWIEFEAMEELVYG